MLSQGEKSLENASISYASFYEFAKVTRPQNMKDLILDKCSEEQLLGTVTLSYEGINGSLAGTEESLTDMLSWLTKDVDFTNLMVNHSIITTSPFDRLVVKIKEEIVTSGFKNIDSDESTYVTPENWDLFIQEEDVTTIDVRNFYEHSIGSFVKAIRPNIRSFREFPKFVAENLEGKREKKIAIYCTGGIRCEKASGLLSNFGFRNVFQLKGGIFSYFHRENKTSPSLWAGDCFVFDKRLAVDDKFRTLNYEQCPSCKRMVAKKNLPVSEIEWADCPDCLSRESLNL